jgi:hypothetical protein
VPRHSRPQLSRSACVSVSWEPLLLYVQPLRSLARGGAVRPCSAPACAPCPRACAAFTAGCPCPCLARSLHLHSDPAAPREPRPRQESARHVKAPVGASLLLRFVSPARVCSRLGRRHGGGVQQPAQECCAQPRTPPPRKRSWPMTTSALCSTSRRSGRAGAARPGADLIDDGANLLGACSDIERPAHVRGELRCGVGLPCEHGHLRREPGGFSTPRTLALIAGSPH